MPTRSGHRTSARRAEPASLRIRYEFGAFLSYLAVLAVAGGSSHWDSLAQVVVRIAAIAVLAALLLRKGAADWSLWRRPLILLLAGAAIAVIQLVPLPPGLWSNLPGHLPYADAAALVGTGEAWRPINLTPDRGWNAALAFLPPMAVLVGLAHLSRDERGQLPGAFSLVALASLALGVLQVSAGGFRYHATQDTFSALGFFANRNHQAIFLAATLPVLVLWGQGREGGRAGLLRPMLAYGSMALIILLIPMTGSRTGLLCAALGLAFALLLSAGHLRQLFRRLGGSRAWIGWAALAVLLLIVIGLAIGSDQALSVNRFFSEDIRGGSRREILPPLWRMIRDFFPFGSGLGSFDAVYRQYEPYGSLRSAYMNQAHDDPLQVVQEAGVLGLALLLAFLLWWVRSAWTAWRTPVRSRAVRLARAGVGVTLIFMLSSLVDYPLRTPLAAALFVVGCSWMLEGAAAARAKLRPDISEGSGLP